jgi:asparagine synthase (glutamine-hydrolysing)
MCGFCGFIVENNQNCNVSFDVLKEMTGVLAHRGPDNDGYFHVNTEKLIVGFGHRRLSIIDLSERADQPIGNEDNTVIVAFNGEIYNYRQLTRELKDKGHLFKSDSDTEVVVHLYEDYKEDCVNKLEGMFAFALWDKKVKRLILARDRMGIKPVFYSLKGNNIYFASEIKSLLLSNEISRRIDYKALDYYITFGYIPGERTIFKNIKKLQPASFLIFENDVLISTKYWSLEYLPKYRHSEKEIEEQLISLFENTVKKHLISDVPLGSFLSGGLDSSIIVALMSRIGKSQVNTFSLGFSSGGKDELEYASAVAGYYNTHHQEFKVNPEMTQILPKLVWHLDEPFFDNSIIPTYYLSKLARDYVKVVLTGDGGDEIFGGYEWTRRNQYQRAYKVIPSLFRKGIEKCCMGNLEIQNEYGNSWKSKVRRFFHDLDSSLEEGFRRRTSVSDAFRQMIYSDEMKNELNGFSATNYQSLLFNQINVNDRREKMLYVDTLSFLPDDCLFKVDRMSMAHGLEVRVPFLDRELVEFSAKLPFEYKIRRLTSKYILKKTFAQFLPKMILKQRKQGFTIPISAWLRGELGTTVKNVLLSKQFNKRNIFKKNQIEWMLENHKSGKQDLGHRLWSLFVFEIWARLYLDGKIISKPTSTLDELVA